MELEDVVRAEGGLIDRERIVRSFWALSIANACLEDYARARAFEDAMNIVAKMKGSA